MMRQSILTFLNDFEWLNIRHLIDCDLATGVLMYKAVVNGHGPGICKESFHSFCSIHGHATMSAVKSDLFLTRKTTSIA